jgi:hypothetical protein
VSHDLEGEDKDVSLQSQIERGGSEVEDLKKTGCGENRRLEKVY